MSGVEMWRDVPGYEGIYRISSFGQVYSQTTSRNLKRSINASGYFVINLRAHGLSRQWFVHRLVLLAFVGPCPTGQETRHLDGDRLNPRLDNLVWGTHRDNIQDVIRHGRQHELRKTHCPRGHAYTPENTYISPSRPRASRTCKQCDRERRWVANPKIERERKVWTSA